VADDSGADAGLTLLVGAAVIILVVDTADSAVNFTGRMTTAAQTVLVFATVTQQAISESGADAVHTVLKYGGRLTAFSGLITA